MACIDSCCELLRVYTSSAQVTAKKSQKLPSAQAAKASSFVFPLALFLVLCLDVHCDSLAAYFLAVRLLDLLDYFLVTFSSLKGKVET